MKVHEESNQSFSIQAQSPKGRVFALKVFNVRMFTKSRLIVVQPTISDGADPSPSLIFSGKCTKLSKIALALLQSLNYGVTNEGNDFQAH